MKRSIDHDGTKGTKKKPFLYTVFFVTLVIFAPSWSSAQAPSKETITLAPIECWTRTSSGAVRVGEIFTLVLTCAVVETQSTTVVPDRSRLDPGALQVPPFEVVSGSQAADIRTRTHRFFQYEYAVRFIGEQIGADVELPGPTISYRVQSRVQGDEAVESRDRQYNLPPRRIRIVSLVPLAAADIQDAVPDTFRQIEDRRFRANLLRIVSWALSGIGVIVGIWALAALVKRPQADAARRRLAPGAVVLRAARRELDRVREDRRVAGWSQDLAARALTPLRVAASYAAGRPVAQSPAASTAEASPGQLLVTSWHPRRRAVLVSGSATAATMKGDPNVGVRTGTGSPGGADLQGGSLGDLQAALGRFTAAAYGRTSVPDSDLDDALEQGDRAVRQVARRFTPAARLVRAARQAATGGRSQAWAR